jgi:hypothetical protein
MTAIYHGATEAQREFRSPTGQPLIFSVSPRLGGERFVDENIQ